MQQSSAFIALYTEQKEYKDGGGGGKPKIDLLGNAPRPNANLARNKLAKRSSMRAISRRPLSTEGSRISVVAKVSYKQNSSLGKKSLSATINYNLDRERGIDEQERSLFTSKFNELDRSIAKEDIERKFGEDIAYHKIILSSGDNHISQRQFTRTVMAEWQKSIEKDFEYYAVEHRNTDHHHVHIVIPGRSSGCDVDLSFNREDIAVLREIGSDYLARDRFMDRELDRAVDLEFGRTKLDREIEKLFHMSKRDYEREQTSVGLETYKEMGNTQKELGLLFQYEPDRISRSDDQPDKDYVLLEENSAESRDDASTKEYESDWDDNLSDKLYGQTEAERAFENGDIEHEQPMKARRQNEDDSE